MKKAKDKKEEPVAPPVERYSLRRKAEFLLNNAIDASDYQRARKQVRLLGLDPESIPHVRPTNPR